MFFKKEAGLKEELGKEISELKKELSNLKSIVFRSSMGNKGVQTDIRQTPVRQQTDMLDTTKVEKGNLGTTLSAEDMVNLVNDFRKSLNMKFKSLTNQEFFIFSVIYGLEEQFGAVSYSDISQKTGLSESAIRDHVCNLSKKGIDIIKEKANNRINFFRISPELKELVSLDTLTKIHNPYMDKRQFSEEVNSLIRANL